MAAFVLKLSERSHAAAQESTDIPPSHYNLLTRIHDHTVGSSWCDVLSSQLPTSSNCSCFHRQELHHIPLHIHISVKTWLKVSLSEVFRLCLLN